MPRITLEKVPKNWFGESFNVLSAIVVPLSPESESAALCEPGAK